MTRIQITLATLCCSAALFATSCKKTPAPVSSTTGPTTTTPTGTTTTTPTSTGPSADKSKLNTIFKDLRSTPQSFSVTAGIMSTVTGTQGTKLTFYPNSFKDASGNTITSGTINIQLVEMYKPGDMIANMATTTSSGNLLQSGGQVSISATKGGTKVYAGKYGIAYKTTSSATAPMDLYYGNTANADSIVTWGTASIAAGTASVTPTVDSSGGGSGSVVYYPFDSCTDFTYVNCDRFYSVSGPKTNVNIVVPDTSFNSSNTRVFVVFPSINSVSIAGSYNASTHTFAFYDGYKIPEGITVSIVVMTNKGGSWHYYEALNYTAVTNMSVTATMTSQTLTYIKSKLAAL